MRSELNARPRSSASCSSSLSGHANGLINYPGACWDTHTPGVTNHRRRLRKFGHQGGRRRVPGLHHNTATMASLWRASGCPRGELMGAETTCGCSLIEPEGHSHALHQHSALLTLEEVVLVSCGHCLCLRLVHPVGLVVSDVCLSVPQMPPHPDARLSSHMTDSSDGFS